MENINPNEKSSQSQNARILKHLQSGGKVTALSAFDDFQCMRLSARIKDLRDLGYTTTDEFITMPSGKRVKQYFIEAGV
ncbi:hypothetical protein BKG91_12110 [Rodentibacter caecimuris]|uniref:helix-turn-helix domain-containing protein n=1 Tax=Rodentibacter caecimuris TaxID=1796644 RepID=UPI000750B85D|nr:helix-turn-helix domain-containing protein [Rodentibacter heylii]AOF53689.1 hypothetical protein AC062_1597 [Pasteurellaceae bacterium NI1060]OOF69981.1 hypothetical protein BKG91_12110 [Rodentibacter heylii]